MALDVTHGGGLSGGRVPERGQVIFGPQVVHPLRVAVRRDLEEMLIQGTRTACPQDTFKRSRPGEKDIAILDEFGVPYQVLDRAGCLLHEPALASVQGKFVGGLRLPGVETGDCFKFTQQLALAAQVLGARLSLRCEGRE